MIVGGVIVGDSCSVDGAGTIVGAIYIILFCKVYCEYAYICYNKSYLEPLLYHTLSVI